MEFSCGASIKIGGRNGVVGIAGRYGLDDAELELGGGEIFWTHPDRPRGPPSLQYRGTGSFSGIKAAGAWRWSTTSVDARRFYL